VKKRTRVITQETLEGNLSQPTNEEFFSVCRRRKMKNAREATQYGKLAVGHSDIKATLRWADKPAA